MTTCLQPIATILLDTPDSAGPVREVRCLTMDAAMAEMDREAMASEVTRRRALATADFHERVSRHLDARGRQGEAERAREAAGRVRGEVGS